jgi:hypothetical protein
MLAQPNRKRGVDRKNAMPRKACAKPAKFAQTLTRQGFKHGLH